MQDNRGSYSRPNLIADEDISDRATAWLRKETSHKSHNLTTARFTRWVNDDLIPSLPQPHDYSTISAVTAWRWLNKLGFEFSKFKRGYVDGHERADVIAYRNQFLQKIKVLEDTHKPLPTASDGYHPYRIGIDSAEKELVLIFHDESCFHSNVGNTSGWHEKGKMPLLPKDQGKGLMLSDYIDGHNGFLRLSEAEKHCADDTIPPIAREILIFGENNEGYFTSDRFMLQVAKAARISSFKYPPERYDVTFVFDQAKIHIVYDDDALVASKMNVHPGGKAPKMRTSPLIFNGRPQSMVLSDGRPKGLKMVLEERGVNTQGMVKDDMVKKLNEFPDFKNEKNRVERLLRGYEQSALFLPKFHPELKPIERVWGMAKRFARNKCDYTFHGLQNVITPAMESVTLDNIRKFFRKSREYILAFRNGHSGYKADEVVKEYKSHRRVAEAESIQ